MALQEMWVHGHSAEIELNSRGRGSGEDIAGRQWTAIEGLRMGPGVQYLCQDDSDYWFHFAIPTPVVDDGVRARFRRATVLFTAGPGVTLNALHVWDGWGPPAGRPVFSTPGGLAIGGANHWAADGRNSFALPNVEVQMGVGISVLFHFSDPGTITLHAAGIEFES